MSTRAASRKRASTKALPECPECGNAHLGGLGWSSSRRRPRWRRLLRRIRRLLAIVVALGLLGGVMLAGLIMVTPSVSSAPSQAATLARAHRAPFPGPPVPQRFTAALVATEDHRFYSEPGLDPLAIARVTAGSLTGRPDQGGSTLYQQLAKMLYTPGGSGPMAETEQVVLGVKLAFSYPRAEVLRMYAAVAYFGHGYYGLAEASCGYFGVSPAALSWPQAAMLVGLLPAPSAYDPIAHFALAKTVEQHVFGRLVATGRLTQAEADLAVGEPLHVLSGREAPAAARPGCR